MTNTIGKINASNCICECAPPLAHKRIGIVGMGRTGVACTQFLARRRANLTLFDRQPMSELSAEARDAAGLAQRAIIPYTDSTELPPLDMLIVSPGVPPEDSIVRRARRIQAQVIGELELAYRFINAPIVAVSGTCGKGTTATTLGSLLDAASIPNVVAGNIGDPLIRYADKSDALDIIVAEVSSFQLETTERFHPCVSILLNITEDHLERYEDFEAYAQAKGLLFRNQTAEDWAILCIEDRRVRSIAGSLSPQVLTIALNDTGANGYVDGDRLVVSVAGGGAEAVARRADVALPGRHHVINALAAVIAARLVGVPTESIAPALRAYEPAPHLMTLVAQRNGVRYIDDSKATNPASAIADIAGMAGPLIVIAGGKEKQTDFEEFGSLLAERARRVILLGECAERIQRAVAKPGICTRAESMDEAVQLAVQSAEPGDTVALCPACSSLDMFDSYAQRGVQFANSVLKHISKHTPQAGD